MKKIIYPVLGLIFVACGQTPSGNTSFKNASAKEQAVALTDSALKIMKEGSGKADLDQSLKLLDEAIEKDPYLQKAYRYKMNIYNKMGDDTKIFETMVEQNKSNPANAYSSLNLGIEYERRGQKQMASEEYSAAITLFSSTLDTLPETSNSLLRNTAILNLALASALANKPLELSKYSDKMTKPEIENLETALNSFNTLNREDLLNFGKSKS